MFAGASISLVGCSFLHNQLFPSNFGAAVIQADGDDRYGASNVRLQGCTFHGNTPDSLPVLLADNRDDETTTGRFYSESPTPQLCVYEGPDDTSVPPPCEFRTPASLGAADDVFLDGESVWLQQVKQVRESALLSVISPPRPAIVVLLLLPLGRFTAAGL